MILIIIGIIVVFVSGALIGESESVSGFMEAFLLMIGMMLITIGVVELDTKLESKQQITPEVKIEVYQSGDEVVSDTTFIYKK